MKKHDMVPLTEKGTVKSHQSKGKGPSKHLPSRAAMPSFTRPGATINDYSKASPLGLDQPSPGILDFGG